MRKIFTGLLLAAVLLLSACGGKTDSAEAPQDTAASTEATVPATVPPDGDPNDVTCKGSYTNAGEPDSIVTASGTWALTNEQLSVWYWAEVAQYRQENHEIAPDFERPLDTQPCEIDESVNSWQQYFLKQALSAWHTAQALNQYSDAEPLPTEAAYQPNLTNHEKYMTGMPATDVLYGHHTYYRPNSMHQAYLDALPETLEILAEEKGYGSTEEMARDAFGASVNSLELCVSSSNESYMYFTHMSYYIEPTAEELDTFYQENASSYPQSGTSVDFRQILLVPQDVVQADERPSWQQKQEPRDPVILEEVRIAGNGTVTCSEEAWAICEAQAQEILTYWQKKNRGTEATFGETAHKYTMDPGTQVNGGLYQDIRQGQMTAVIDEWCFDPARQVGDTAILRSDYGVHILYFCASQEAGRADAQKDYIRVQQEALIAEAKEAYPIDITYSKISLTEAEPSVSASDLLYPDIAHERFPEVPLYLQQDYPNTMYGGFKITSNGCGITTFAMVASYLTDDELTPPEMCDRYGRYSHANGTDGMIFNIESAVLGFYLREKTYDTRVAKAALEDGHLVVSVQHPGYWTRGGHYIACESINEEGLVQVRDSNIYNYFRVPTHKEDLHKWSNITAAGSGYWIFDHKITNIPACSRCGAPEGVTESLLQSDYICEKCAPALLRRTTYLNG